jgi:hypothetical protein
MFIRLININHEEIFQAQPVIFTNGTVLCLLYFHTVVINNKNLANVWRITA